MRYPMLSARKISRNIVEEFRGYNHNLRIGKGEFYDMRNMTGDFYPVLSPRASRHTDTGIHGDIQGIASLNGLCYVQDKKLYYRGMDGSYVAAGFSLTDGEKQLVPFGAYIIVFPDKVWLNTADGTYGWCEGGEQFQGSFGVVWCESDGTPYETVVDGDTAPENTAQMWADGSVLRRWDEKLREWTEVKPSYLKLIGEGVGEPFEKGTKVLFGGDSVLTDIFGAGECTISAREKNWIVVEGKMSFIRKEIVEAQLQISVKMPAMDFVFEHENRLWGCRYGLNNSGEFVNEIYASKLGDFKNWSSSQGVSTDSYVASCGTDGKWTGAIKALGYPLFFKENYLHKVYGSYPANYQIQVIDCRGVQEGCEKSLVTVNEVLYYKSRSGVCAYDGSLPVGVSDAFGNQSFHNAVAGRQGNKYYIAMTDAEDDHHLFCYDTHKGFWHREDELHVSQFCTVNDALYYMEAGKAGIGSIGGQGEATEPEVSWFAETGVIGADDPDRKYISRIAVRLSASIGSQVSFYAKYDSVGSWVHLGNFAGKSLDSTSVPLRIRRCDHLRLRIEGTGEAKIYAIVLTTERGSDLR